MPNKITISASQVKQGSKIIYATSLKVRELLMPNFYSIERLDPENANEKGYQRLLNIGRAKRLSEYIVAGQDTRDALLPTSIVIATDKNIILNPDNNTIVIDIDSVCPFNVLDGQHRVEGLKMAALKDDRVYDYEIPVNITINMPIIEQMCHFLIINTTQKSVEEGIAQRIRARLTKAMDIDYVPNLPKWILNSIQKGEDEKSLEFVDFLNSNDGPWFNNIEMANEDKKGASINQKSFVKSIKKYILVSGNPIIDTESDERQHNIFSNYWKAISNIISDDKTSVLYKYNGVELFCRFASPFFNKLINIGNYKIETMQKLLVDVFENVDGDAMGVGHVEFWGRGGKAGGLNSSALSKINAEMVKVLNKSVNKNKEMDI